MWAVLLCCDNSSHLTRVAYQDADETASEKAACTPVIITQITIKGHLEMWGFAVQEGLGGLKKSDSIWCHHYIPDAVQPIFFT